jgi:ABC-type antimicrobial peptide transport system permease subunit
MMNLLIPGVLGIGILVTFLAVMLGKILAVPLLIIAVVVVSLLVYDFYNEVKATRGNQK